MNSIRIAKSYVRRIDEICVRRKDFLANMGCSLLIVFAFLPIVNFLFGRWINYVRFIIVAIYLLGVLRRDKNLFLKMMVLFIVTIFFNIYYYHQLWFLNATFKSFMVKSMLCWVYASFALYFNRYGSSQGKRNLLNLFMLVLLITSITTIIAVRIDPIAARVLGNANVYDTETERYFYAKNTASWGIIYGMAFALPMLINEYKKNKSLYALLVIGTVIVCIACAQITFAAIFAVAFLACFFLKKMRVKKIVMIISILVLSFLLFRPIIADIVYLVHKYMNEDIFGVLKYKTYQIYLTFKKGSMYGGVDTRFRLYMSSLMTFLKNPIFGFRLDHVDTAQIGLHSQLFDTMAATGLFGTLLYAGAFVYIARSVYVGIEDKATKAYYFVAVIILVIYTFINPTWYAPECYMTVFLLPMLMKQYKSPSGAGETNRCWRR